MGFTAYALQPGTGSEAARSGIPVSFATHVVIKGVKPFMSEATCTGVLGQRQLPGGGNVVRRHAQPAADAILQAQRAPQGDQWLRSSQDRHQITQRLIEPAGCPVPLLRRYPASDLDAAKIEPSSHGDKGHCRFRCHPCPPRLSDRTTLVTTPNTSITISPSTVMGRYAEFIGRGRTAGGAKCNCLTVISLSRLRMMMCPC